MQTKNLPSESNGVTGRDQWLGWLILATWAVFAVNTFWDGWPIDLSSIYFAAHFYGEGAYDLVYASGDNVFWVSPPPEWSAFAAEQGFEGAWLPAYVYPPVWAAFLSPVPEVMSYPTFARLMLVIYVFAIVAIMVLSYRMAVHMFGSASVVLRFPVWALISTGMMLLSTPGQWSLLLGQPQIIVSLMILWAIWCLLGNRDLEAGGWLAVAAAIKLMPALLAVLFIMERRWRALAAFTVIGGALGLVSIAITGWPLHQTLLDRLHGLDAQVLISRINLGAEQVLYHLHQLAGGELMTRIDLPHMEDQPAWIGWATRLILIAGLIHTYLTTRQLPDAQRLWMRFQLVFLFVLLAAPLAWLHYVFLPMLMLPTLIAWGLTRVGWCLLGLIALAWNMPLFLHLATLNWAGFAQVYLQMASLIALFAVLHISIRQSVR